MAPPDTIESAIWYLSHLQSEGWGLDKIELKVEHHRVHGKGARLPVAATLVIRVEPR